AQLDPVAAGQGSRDLLENGGDDPFDIAVMEMRIELADPKGEFRFGHLSPEAAAASTIVSTGGDHGAAAAGIARGRAGWDLDPAECSARNASPIKAIGARVRRFSLSMTS